MALDKPRRFCRDNAGERKTGGIKERAKVRFGSFATADYQHKQVHETGGAVGGIHYIFDEKEGAARTDVRSRLGRRAWHAPMISASMSQRASKRMEINGYGPNKFPMQILTADKAIETTLSFLLFPGSITSW